MNWIGLVSDMVAAGIDEADAGAHVRYLRSAIETSRSEILDDYVLWCRRVEISRTGADVKTLQAVAILSEACRGMPGNVVPDGIIKSLRSSSPAAMGLSQSFLNINNPNGALALEYYEHVTHADRRAATTLVLDALDAGLGIKALYEDIFTPCMHEIGRLWELNELTVGQEHYFTAVTQTVMAQVYPQVFAVDPGDNRLLAATIEGNLHELSIRMVADFFELEGWDTYYLGADAPNREIIDAAHKYKPQVIAISIALGSQLQPLQQLVTQIRVEPRLRDCRILVGGNGLMRLPEDQRLAGADAFAASAAEAVELARSWSLP